MREENESDDFFNDIKRLKKRIDENKDPHKRWEAIVEDYPQIKKFKYFIQLNNKITEWTVPEV